MRSWLAWEASCFAEFVFWWLVVPGAAAFLWLVFFAGDLVVVSGWLYGLVIGVFVVAPLVVLSTAIVGHLRAKKMAAVVETELNDTNAMARPSRQTVERVDGPAHPGSSVVVTEDPTVTKEYFEDVYDDPSARGHDEAYRYWDYTFEFANRAYRARV